jgi:hypothetical protein
MNSPEINKDRMITIKTSEGEIKVSSEKIDEGWNRVMYGDRIKNTLQASSENGSLHQKIGTWKFGLMKLLRGF